MEGFGIADIFGSGISRGVGGGVVGRGGGVAPAGAGTGGMAGVGRGVGVEGIAGRWATGRFGGIMDDAGGRAGCWGAAVFARASARSWSSALIRLLFDDC
jgi:hypothetical protein